MRIDDNGKRVYAQRGKMTDFSEKDAKAFFTDVEFASEKDKQSLFKKK